MCKSNVWDEGSESHDLGFERFNGYMLESVKRYKNEKHGIKQIVQIGSILCWILWLKNSDSYFIISLFVGIIGIISLCNNEIYCRRIDSKRNRMILLGVSIIFAFIPIAANYSFILNTTGPGGGTTLLDLIYKGIIVVILYIGGFCIAQSILIYVMDVMQHFRWKEEEHFLNPILVFVGFMISIAFVNLFVLLNCFYPGTLTPDSIWQIEQGIEGVYSNHHPFYHTLVIKFFIDLGMKLFDNINQAVALYSICQVLFLAGVISFVMITLYQKKATWKWLLVCLVWYILMPYHIMFSFTMWKDVIFGGMVAIFITSMYRIIRQIGNHLLINYGMVFIGGMGMCLFRSNGLFAYILTFVSFIFIFRIKFKKLIFVLSATAVLSLILLYPLLDILKIDSSDPIESLSIPAQQIARVITDCDDITENQKILLAQIVDIEEVPNVYVSYISDPIKNLIRNKDQQSYLTEHTFEYIQLWVSIGIKHPHKYIEAWIDLTKGFWNSGYAYRIWSFGIADNGWGIETEVHSWKIRSVMNNYLWLFNNCDIFQILVGIGFHTWLIMGCCILGILMKKKVVIFVTLPILFIILSLLVATPVYAEFRYIYALFTSIPLILFTLFDSKENVPE